MSDPAKTTAEIEDVLASIRRLVSDNAGGASTPLPQTNLRTAKATDAETATDAAGPDASDLPQPEAVPEPQADSADPLVLTSSLRVSDPEDPWIPVQDAKPGKPSLSLLTDPENTKRNDVDWKPDDRLLAFEDVSAGEQTDRDRATKGGDADKALTADFEPETGDDNWPNTGAKTALLSLVARREALAVMTDEASEDQTSKDETREDHTPEDHAAESAQLEGDHHADNSKLYGAEVNDEDDESIQAAEMADAGRDDEEPAANVTALGALVAQAKRGAAAAETTDRTTPSAGDDEDGQGSELEAAQDGADDQGLSDEHSQDGVDQTDHGDEDTSPQTQEDHGDEAPAEQDAAPQDTQAAEAAGDTAGDLGETTIPLSVPDVDADEDDEFLDEDTLRAIIADVVREELQGMLGQRVTRNVRKMVRREVRLAMAMAADDLE